MNLWFKKLNYLMLISLLLPIFVFADAGMDNESTNYLFIQAAQSCSIYKNKNSNDYTVVLHNVDPWINYFSNAPKRTSGFTQLPQYIEALETTIEKIHPKGINLGLVALNNEKNKKVIKYTLTARDFNYAPASSTVTFKAIPVPGEQQDPIPNQINLKHTALFIDSVCISCIADGF